MRGARCCWCRPAGLGRAAGDLAIVGNDYAVRQLRQAGKRIKTVMRDERAESGVLHHAGVCRLEGGNHA